MPLNNMLPSMAMFNSTTIYRLNFIHRTSLLKVGSKISLQNHILLSYTKGSFLARVGSNLGCGDELGGVLETICGGSMKTSLGGMLGHMWMLRF